MRILPRSRAGRVLLAVALLLIALDVMTVFGSIHLVMKRGRWSRQMEFDIDGGAVGVLTSLGRSPVYHLGWGRPERREWFASSQKRCTAWRR